METFTLRALRVNRGLSLEEASKLLGITKDTLASYELGKTFPTVPIIKKMEDLYNMPYDKINFLVDDNENIVIEENKEG